MSKKDKRKKQKDHQSEQRQVNQQPLLSKRGWKWVGVGIGIVCLGFLVLSFTDPRGQNLASKISPFLILGGYAVIAVGIVKKDPQ